MKAILINADERKITAVDAGDPNKSLEMLMELIGYEWMSPSSSARTSPCGSPPARSRRRDGLKYTSI